MCFAPQRRALFSTSQLPKVLRTWLQNVLRATTVCNFSSLIWPDGSAPAALASLLFDPPEPQIIGKTQCFATLLSFHALHLLSSAFFSSLIFFLLLFSSLTLPTSAFSSVHIYVYIYICIVGSLTSKLPSVTLCEVPRFLLVNRKGDGTLGIFIPSCIALY